MADSANDHQVQERLFDLRDYFAGQALFAVAMLAVHFKDAAMLQNPPPEGIARAAYEIADAMLAEKCK